MSFVIPTSKLTPLVINNLTFQIVVNKYNPNVKRTLKVYREIHPGEISIPYFYAVSKMGIKRRNKSEFAKLSYEFGGTLRPPQVKVCSECIKDLKTVGTSIISCYTGFGKTITSIYIAARAKLRTLIVVNKIILMNQWRESINKFCPTATIHELKPKKDVVYSADFYIVNAINIPKLDTDLLNTIGFVIVDETHLILAEVFSQSLFYLHPRYFIGLSATPYRYDGLDKLFLLYFGSKRITRELRKEHTVYEIYTGFIPKVVQNSKTGRIEWNELLNSICTNEKRNELIVKTAINYGDKNILILTKRIVQGKYLLRRLKEEGESVTSLMGQSQEFDRDARIIIGTTSKLGVGFDLPKLNALLLACDVKDYYIQILGRIMRTPDHPIIVEFIDSNDILMSHYLERKKVYRKIGGKILSIK